MSYQEDPLVTHLQRLSAENTRDEPDRAALAALRGSLAKDDELSALRLVLPALRIPKDAHPSERLRQERAAVLVAQLYALHPVTGEASLAAALRAVMRQRESESIELRFRALLSAGPEELAAHLRHLVTLIATSGLGIDWADLRQTVLHWTAPDSRQRRQWARDFWAYETDDATEITTTTST